MPESSKEQLLKSIYYDAANPASFGSVDKLYREAIINDGTITRRDVEDFLAGQLTYSLHRRIVRRFTRNPTVADHHGYQAQADLIDVQKYASANNGVRYILTVIDIFSKLAYAIPLKDKRGGTLAAAFTELLKIYRPSRLQTDEGTEFTNRLVQKVLQDNFVHFFIAKNEAIKCAVIERFQRTLMSRIHKYFTSKGTRKFVDVLDDFIGSYNTTVHRSIKMRPIDAMDHAQKETVFETLYGAPDRRSLIKKRIAASRQRKKKEDVNRRQTGNIVRIPQLKNIFSKGYRQNFTDQLYKILYENKSGQRPIYKLASADDGGREIPGTFYPEEVQKVTSDDLYRVRILRERGKGRNKEVLIEYENTNSPPRWIKASDLQSIA